MSNPNQDLLPRPSRRLAAIMFTDIVGYSAMTQRNEASVGWARLPNIVARKLKRQTLRFPRCEPGSTQPTRLVLLTNAVLHHSTIARKVVLP